LNSVDSVEVVLDIASELTDGGNKVMNEFYAHYGLPHTFYDRFFAEEFLHADAERALAEFGGSGTKQPKQKLSRL